MSQVQADREQLLANAFVGLSDTLVDTYDVIDVLDRLVGHSVTLLAAEAAGILLADPHGRLRVVASSSEESDWTELMQIQADDGPCVECIRTGHPVTVTDLNEAAGRWPRFAAALRERTSPGVIIEQAKGVLSQLGGVPMDVAFERLRRYARSHNTLLSEIAGRVVADRRFALQILAVKVR